MLSAPKLRAIAVAIPLLAGLAGHAQSQSSPAAGAPDRAPYKISVNVDMVLLDATVRDRKGRPVTDLREDNFNVYEDGIRQSIRLFRHEDVPVAVGLVVDHSGSMRPKLPHVLAAARTFVQISNPDDRMFVVNFNEKVTVGLPNGVGFTNRSDLLQNAISRAPTTGMTALYDATILAVERLPAGVGVKKALLLISDGGDNASRHTLAELTQLAARSSVVIYAIGIFDPDDPDHNPDVLRRLAVASGGEAFFPAEYADVVAICGRIARDIRSQYTIGYVSSSTGPPGVWRSIQVVAGATPKEKLSVRTRTGYIAAGESRPAREADKW